MNETKQLQALLKEGRIGRRDFLAGASALGLSIAAAGTLADKALAATPKQGGRMRIGLGHGSTTDSLDPATFENDFTIFTGYAYRNHLTEVSNTDQLIPELAESWEASDDAKQWTFKLREGVEFHNAKTLTAGDVVASINHHRGEDSKSAAKPLVDPIVDVKADGEHTVVFTLQDGNADFPYIVSDYHLAIMPAKDGTSNPACAPPSSAIRIFGRRAMPTSTKRRS
jgi:peptide/nickel transport system substrate-binding protein